MVLNNEANKRPLEKNQTCCESKKVKLSQSHDLTFNEFFNTLGASMKRTTLKALKNIKRNKKKEKLI